MSTFLQQLTEDQDLSPELSAKAQTLFEAALAESTKALVEQETAAIKERYKNLLEAEVKVQKRLLKEDHDNAIAELRSGVESFIQTSILEWAEANKVAIDGAVKVRLAESFLESMGALLNEHQVKVPEQHLSVIEEQAARIEQLEQSLLETAAEGDSFRAKVEQHDRAAALAEACAGLVGTDVERVRALLEDVEYHSAEQFTAKAKILAEAISKPAVSTGEQITEQQKPVQAPVAAPARGDDLVVENQAPVQEPQVTIDPSVASYLDQL